MTKFIDETEDYFITDIIHFCCDAMQFKYVCRICNETMNCYFCGFDPYGPHGCVTVQP